MRITIEKYNPAWIDRFVQERSSLLHILDNPEIKIEHIGSTAVPGLAAKPVIDILIGLADLSMADEYIMKIESVGYEYIKVYEEKIPERRFFRKEKNGLRTHHIHMVELNSNFWKRHLLFRDHLRENQKAREDYQQLKLSLTQKEWDDVNEYAEAKTEFIRKIEESLFHV